MSKPIFSGLSRSVFDDANPSPYADGLKKGVDEAIVRQISGLRTAAASGKMFLRLAFHSAG